MHGEEEDVNPTIGCHPKCVGHKAADKTFVLVDLTLTSPNRFAKGEERNGQHQDP